MTELTGDPYPYGASDARPRRSLALSALGAAVALAGVAALGAWGYGLTTRDPGEIPFLRAEEGPTKIAPDDPGGLKLETADLAVTRMLSSDKPEETTLAPPPEMPADEDLPAHRLDAAATAAAGRAASPEVAPATPSAAIDLAVLEALSRDEDGTGPADPGADLAGPGAPVASPFAAPRPSAAEIAAAPPAPLETASETRTARAEGGPASGDVAVQLGAFNTAAIAESQWRRHRGRNGDLLGDFGHAVTTVQSGGRTLYRLRVGPMPSPERAGEICAALKSRGDACIVARMR